MPSFKDFAKQFVKVTLPTTMKTVASTIGFDEKPLSLHAMMDTAAPYVPDLTWAPFVDNSQSTPPDWQLIFLWTDLANLPPWDYDSGSWSGPPPNTARAATSWQFTVWPPGGSPVIDATVPVANENTVGGVQFIYKGELVGDFDYQITAYNNYGSSSTGKQSVTITLGNPVSAPANGLGSNFNYIFYSDCNPLTDLAVTINVTKDIVCQSASGDTKGVGFQLNGLSPRSSMNQTITAQQFVIDLSGNELAWTVNLWSGTGPSIKLIGAGSNSLTPLSSSKIPAGYQFRISLQYGPKSVISGATFSVIDNGNTLASPVITLTSLPDPVQSSQLAPIVAFQLNIVGPQDKESVVLSSGSGSIVYEASSPLTLSNSPQCGVTGGTFETANSTYGALTSGPGSIFSQPFSVST